MCWNGNQIEAMLDRFHHTGACINGEEWASDRMFLQEEVVYWWSEAVVEIYSQKVVCR